CHLFAATSVLPPRLVRNLTFSTYEHAPLTCRARVVGADPGAELPAGCYSGSCLGFHRDRDSSSDLGEVRTFFAEKIVSLLAEGKLHELEKFAGWCEERKVNDSTLLDLAFRLKTSKDYAPTEEKVHLALEQGPLGKVVLERKEVIERLSLKNCLLALENDALA